MKIIPLHNFLYHNLKHEHCISIIGGGGKTTLLYTLGKIFSKQHKTILTTTTHMMKPTHIPIPQLCLEEDIEIVKQINNLLYIALPFQGQKLKGPCESFLAQSLSYCEYMFIEADGAKCLDIKFERNDEPAVPSFCDCVIQVVGIRALGKTLKECLHRYELATQAFHWKEDDILDEEKLITLIKHNFSHTSCKRKIVIINQIDTQYDLSYIKKLKKLTAFEIWFCSLHNNILISTI